MASPPKPGKEGRAKDKPRLDVSTPPPALTHSPFAALTGAPAAAGSAPPAELPSPAELPLSAGLPPPGDAPPGQSRPGARPPPGPAAAKPRGRLVLRRETKHRGGKTVVIVTGFAQLASVSERELAELLQLLKQRLGCGGAVLERELLLQGDRPAQVAALLREQGFRVDGVTS